MRAWWVDAKPCADFISHDRDDSRRVLRAMNSSSPLLACSGSLMLGGSTTFLVNLSRSFHERGLVLDVVGLDERNEMAADFAAAGARVQCLPRRRLIYEDRIHAAWRAMAARKPVAVLACLGAESFEPLRLLPAGVARLGVIQSDDPAPYAMARNYASWLDAIVGVSTTICDRLRKDGAFAKTRIEHIPYGIAFGPENVRAPRDFARPLKLVYLGRMIEEQKRVSRLVELARLLAARGENFEFMLAGSGSELATVQEALRGLPSARCLGEIPNSETRALLRSQDVLVILSDYEGLPLSLLEAMGEGVVPVVSDLESGLRQVVTEQTGICVPVGNVAAAADAIGALARDPARLAALSSAAGKLAREEYSAARMGQRYLDLIGAIAKPGAVWPEHVSVPAPVELKPEWLYQGLGRSARRWLKRIF